jgi:hypothetical protein
MMLLPWRLPKLKVNRVPVEQQSVATPQAARGWARPSGRRFKNQSCSSLGSAFEPAESRLARTAGPRARSRERQWSYVATAGGFTAQTLTQTQRSRSNTTVNSRTSTRRSLAAPPPPTYVTVATASLAMR